MKGEPIPQESRELISDTDSRGRMPGFFKGPLPQNYEATQEPSKTGAVAAQIDHIEADGSVFVQIKNKIERNSRLCWLDPENHEEVSIADLKNVKNESIDALHPGTNGLIRLNSDVTKRTKFENFAFLVLKKD